jgi:hypothetical protein
MQVLCVDARYPLLHFPPSVYAWITKEMCKPMILVLNKIDLISQRTLDAWVEYFGRKYPDMRVVTFSSFPNEDTVVFAGEVEEVRRVRVDELKPSTKQPTSSHSLNNTLGPAPRQTHVKQERMADLEARSGQSQRLAVKPHGVAELIKVVESIAAGLQPTSADEHLEPADDDDDDDDEEEEEAEVDDDDKDDDDKDDDDKDADVGETCRDTKQSVPEPAPAPAPAPEHVAITEEDVAPKTRASNDGERPDAVGADVASSCMSAVLTVPRCSLLTVVQCLQQRRQMLSASARARPWLATMRA